MLLLESDWQFQIPHQQSQKYKKPAVKCQTSPFSGGSLGTRLVILHTHTHTRLNTPTHYPALTGRQFLCAPSEPALGEAPPLPQHSGDNPPCYR